MIKLKCKKLNKSELRQLWLVAENYLELAEEEYNELEKNDPELIRQVQGKIGDEYENALPAQNIKRLTIALGHYSSAAVRMYTIEEALNTGRLQRHNKQQGSIIKKNKNTISELLDFYNENLNNNIHFLLRLNCAHSEEPSNNSYKIKTDARGKTLMKLSLCDIKGYIDRVRSLMEYDLKGENIIC